MKTDRDCDHALALHVTKGEKRSSFQTILGNKKVQNIKSILYLTNTVQYILPQTQCCGTVMICCGSGCYFEKV